MLARIGFFASNFAWKTRESRGFAYDERQAALSGGGYRTRPVTSLSLDRQLRPIGHSIARNLTQTAIGMLSISPTWVSWPVA